MFQKLSSRLTRANKGKKRVSIGQVREILSGLSLACYQDPAVVAWLLKNGKRLARRK